MESTDTVTATERSGPTRENSGKRQTDENGRLPALVAGPEFGQ